MTEGYSLSLRDVSHSFTSAAFDLAVVLPHGLHDFIRGQDAAGDKPKVHEC
jgi:hypothetical protein